MIMRPCPFCGVQPRVTLENKEDLGFCQNDKCVISFKVMMIDQWNERPLENRLKKIIDKLLNAIQFSYDDAFSRKTVNARFKSVIDEIQKELGIAKVKK